MIYLLIIFLLLVLVYHFDIKGTRQNRDFWYHIVLIIFVLVAGLRYRVGIDTPIYIEDYFHDTPELMNFKAEGWSNSVLWLLLCSLGRTIGVKFFVLQLIEAAFVNIVIFKYIRKHSPYIFTCVFFFFIWMYASYCMEAMKAGFSMAICLYANDYIREKKWLYGSLLFLVATLFHSSSLLILAFSFISVFRFNTLGLLLLAGAFFVGIVVEDKFGDIISLLSFDDYLQAKAETYIESDRYSLVSGKNIFYYLYHHAPLVFSSLMSFYVVKKGKINSSLMKLESMLFMFVLSYIISANIIIYYRIYQFYVIYFILYISQATVDVVKRNNIYGKYSGFMVFCVLIPFFFFVYTTYSGDRWMRYIPYSSVIEKSMDWKRERMYDYVRLSRTNPSPNKNEY